MNSSWSHLYIQFLFRQYSSPNSECRLPWFESWLLKLTKYVSLGISKHPFAKWRNDNAKVPITHLLWELNEMMYIFSTLYLLLLPCVYMGTAPHSSILAWRIPWIVFWPGEFHGLYSPCSRKESDTTEWLSHAHTHTHTPPEQDWTVD